jgi:hypothetical protein
MEPPRDTTSVRRGPTGFYWHPQRPQNHLVVKDDCTKGRRAQEMIQLKGREIAKVLLDEIGRTRTYGLDARREVRTSRMGQCEDCERLWKAYQTATIESVQLYEELKSITEDQGLEKLSGTTARAEAAERLREEARQRLAEHQAATGHR